MAGIRSFGIQLTVATNAIGGLKSVSIPETEITFIDTTTHDSADRYRTFVGGLRDGGTVQISGNYLIGNTGQAYLRNKDNQGGSPVACTIEFSDGSTAEFNAVVGGYGVENGEDDVVTFTSSLRISGPITYAAA